MVALKGEVQERAENVLKNNLKPLLLNQTIYGTSSILKVQTKSRIRWLFALFTIAAICNLILAVGSGIAEDLSINNLAIGVASIICRVLLIVQFLLITLESFCTSRFTVILKAILEVNLFVKCIGSNRKTLIFSWVSSIFLFGDTCHALFQSAYYLYGRGLWWNYNFVITMFSVLESEMLLCVILIRTITEQLEYVNRDLVKVVAMSKKKTSSDIGRVFYCLPRNITTLKIKQIYKNYDKIVHNVKSIQDFYSYQVLGYIVIVFTFQMQRSEMIILFETVKENLALYDLVSNIHGFVRYFIPILTLCFSCEKLYAQVDKIKHSLVHVAIHNDDSETQRVCRLMLHIMRLQPPELVALGLFRVDLRLVLRYLAFLATYVVVIVQFSY